MSKVKRDANAKRRQSIKFRREALDNFGNPRGYQTQSATDADILYRFASLPERYQRNDVCLHMHARIGLHDFCAIFKYSGPAEDDVIIGHITPGTVKGANPNLCSHHLDEPMFVGIVKLFQAIEEIPPTIEWPTQSGLSTVSAVWLQPLDSCLMFRFQAANHVSPAASGGPLGPSMPLESHHFPTPNPSRIPMPEDRELSIPCLCWRFVQLGELEHQPIEGRAQIVHDFPDPDTPFVKIRHVDCLRPIDILSRLQIHLRSDDLILGLTPEAFLKATESLNFTYCTPYLEAWAIERMHEVHSHHELMLRNCAQV